MMERALPSDTRRMILILNRKVLPAPRARFATKQFKHVDVDENQGELRKHDILFTGSTLAYDEIAINTQHALR